VAIAKRDHKSKLKIGRVAAESTWLKIQLVSTLGAERDVKLCPHNSQQGNHNAKAIY
jgi:hypothetical protein